MYLYENDTCSAIISEESSAAEIFKSDLSSEILDIAEEFTKFEEIDQTVSLEVISIYL